MDATSQECGRKGDVCWTELWKDLGVFGGVREWVRMGESGCNGQGRLAAVTVRLCRMVVGGTIQEELSLAIGCARIVWAVRTQALSRGGLHDAILNNHESTEVCLLRCETS